MYPYRQDWIDRRKEPRIQTAGAGELTVLGSKDVTHFTVKVADISRSGLQVVVDSQLDSGISVELRLRGYIVSGKVGVCQPNGQGRYRVGILTTHVTPFPE